MSRLSLGMCAALLTACATPRSDLPPINAADLAQQQIEVQREAVSDALAREERVLRLAWPLLEANAELCPRVAPRFGFRLGDAKTIEALAKGLREDDVEALGWDDKTTRILSVAPGAPASEAGIDVLDRIVAVDGKDEESRKDIDKAVRRYTEEFLEEQGDDDQEITPITFTLERDGETRDVSLKPVEVCDVRVVSSPKSGVNATADFDSITLWAGLLREVEDDNIISFVTAHELAHWAGAHPRKAIQNAGITGAIFWTPPASIAAGFIDLVGTPVSRTLGKAPSPFSTWTRQAAAKAVGITAFEREADYAGLYMLRRSGGSTENIGEIFQTFANISPRSSWLLVSHPTSPERILRIEATAQEIADKEVRGEELIPEGWTKQEH